jgi:DNA-binding transcriptional LysR family regulator
MRSNKKKKPPKEQWTVVEPRILPDWEAAHIFLEVTRSGSFRAAAQKLNQSVNALRRRLDELERELGVPLLIRHVNGVRPTDEGAKIYKAALQMETASFDLLQARSVSDEQAEGEVRVHVPEGLGSAWLMPQLAELQKNNPRLTLNLRCTQRPADLLRLEADISVQLERPTGPDLKIVKLGCLHLMFFASRSYIGAHGSPASPSDFPKHHFVVQMDEERVWEEANRKFFAGVPPHGLVSLRTNVGTGQFWAVSRGIGIGVLPTYVQALGANLVPLNLGVIEKRDIWLAFRPDAKRIARIGATIAWIIQCFDPRRYPWFRDEFIDPDRLAEVYKGPPLAARFDDYQH